jgi:hypothetical protein
LRAFPGRIFGPSGKRIPKAQPLYDNALEERGTDKSWDLLEYNHARSSLFAPRRNPGVAFFVHSGVTFQAEAALATLQEKLAWLDAIRQRVQQFVNEGGDLKSAEAAPLAMALFHAINDLTSEFGFRPSKSASNNPKPIKPDITSP